MEDNESSQDNAFALTVDAILLKSSHEIEGGIFLSHKDGVVTIKWLEDLRLNQSYYTENRNKVVRISENEVCLLSAEDEEEYVIIPIIKKDVVVPLMLDFRVNDPSVNTSAEAAVEESSGKKFFNGIPVFRDGKEDLGKVIFSLTELPMGVKYTDESVNQNKKTNIMIPPKTTIIRTNEDTFEINGKVLYSLHRKSKPESPTPDNSDSSQNTSSNSSTVSTPVKVNSDDTNRQTPSPKNSQNVELRSSLSRSDNSVAQEEVDTDFLNSKMKTFEKKLEVVKLKKTKEAEKRLKSMMSTYERKYSHSFSHDENKYAKTLLNDTPSENQELMNSAFVKELSQKVATKKDEVKSKVDSEMQKYKAKLDPNAPKTQPVQPTQPVPPSPEPSKKSIEASNMKQIESIRQPLTRKFSSFEVMAQSMYLLEPVRLYSEYLSLPDDHFTTGD